MINGMKANAQARRVERLQERCDRLKAENEKLEGEKRALEDALEICRAKLACAKSAEEEFMRQIGMTKQAREQYERAYEDIVTLKAKYSAEIKRLINMMAH